MLIYVGPYVIARCKKEVVEKLVTSCSNKKCYNYGSIITHSCYCSRCGSKIERVPYAVKEFTVDAFKLSYEGMKEAMIFQEHEGAFFWFSNKTTFDAAVGRNTTFEYEFAFQSITSDCIEKEKGILERFHNTEIAKLRECYDYMQIHWGVLSIHN